MVCRPPGCDDALGRRGALFTPERSRRVAFDEGYPYLQVYEPAGSAFSCLEPMTAPTNALVTGECRRAEPGDPYRATFTIRA